MAPIEYVESLLMEDGSDNYAALEHWNKYGNAVSAPSDDEWPKDLPEDRDKLFLNDKVLVPENRVEGLTTGTGPNLCIRAATRCNEIWSGRLTSLWDTTQS